MFDSIKKAKQQRVKNPNSHYEKGKNETQEFNDLSISASTGSPKDTMHENKIIKPDGRMSMDNMIAASHLLSMNQNGREYLLMRYPAIVQRYVEQVVGANAVDENLKVLNQKIVDRLSEEAGKYE